MANVEVGSQLVWKGRKVICTRIFTGVEVLYAPQTSEIMKLEMDAFCNSSVLKPEWDSFNEGDIISIDYQRLELCEIGKNLFFLYPYYKVKRSSNGPEAVSAGNREAASSTAEAGS